MRPGVPLPASRPPRRRLVALGQIVGAAILAACASSPATTRTVSGSIVAPSGLRYTVTLTEQADQACTAERYEVVRTRVKNFPQTSSFCGPIGQAAPPRLIQVTRPAATLIVDRPARCGPVSIGLGRARARPASSRCTPATPHLRLTLVPARRRFTVTGIAGVGQLDLTKSRCGFICTRALTPQAGH
jgi:hypothetical protein